MATQQPILRRIFAQGETPFWRDERVLRVISQIIAAIVIIGLLWWAIGNVIYAANQRGLSLGFGFLRNTAGFPIGETVIPYQPSDTFARAFLDGVLSTLKVSIIGIFFATVLGTIVGVARLSTNWLVSRIALAFIEIHRNIPLLVLLFLWYRGVFTKLPRVQESITWPGPIYMNQRGLFLTWPVANPGGQLFLVSLVVGIVLAVLAFSFLERRQMNSNHNTHPFLVSLAVLILLPLVGWFLSGGDPLHLEQPVLKGFNFQGGMHMTPEFTALLIGLVTYTASFIAEVVRAGIQAVSRGQQEAARALGLSYVETLNLIILPQALRVIIPPLISQYLNLIKNSSLAFFIGYPDLFFIGKTTTDQAGRALQVILLVMAVYLVISLITSLVLNLYNRRIQFVER
jgi:general L-amino acid transport system permease protein